MLLCVYMMLVIILCFFPVLFSFHSPIVVKKMRVPYLNEIAT